MAGPLGPKSYFLYVSDNGINYAYEGRNVDGAAVGNTVVGPDDHPSIPRRLKPRHVWGAAGPGNRRKFTVGSPSNAFYLSGGTISADSEGFIVTGRVGERDQGTVRD